MPALNLKFTSGRESLQPVASSFDLWLKERAQFHGSGTRAALVSLSSDLRERIFSAVELTIGCTLTSTRSAFILMISRASTSNGRKRKTAPATSSMSFASGTTMDHGGGCVAS